MKRRFQMAATALILALSPPVFGQDTAKKDLRAKIEALPEGGLVGDWTVGGQKVRVRRETFLKERHGDKFELGQEVRVQGYMTGETLDADRIDTDD
jgi:hypothetical protein